MATTNASPAGGTAALESPPSAVDGAAGGMISVAEDVTVKTVRKRYEALATVRTKAIKGKGAWYWAHLVPILLHSDTDVPKAVKLRCSLCDAVFSASNPSRTASEHLKRGTCPNFNSTTTSAGGGGGGGGPTPTPAPSSHPKPITSLAPSSSPHYHHHNRKRGPPPPSSSAAYQIPPITVVDPTRFSTPPDIVYSSSSTPPPLSASAHHHHHYHQQQQQHLMLSGGKEDLGALAMLEDSVKKLKSPKTSPGPTLGKYQAESALSLLSDWVYESCGAVSFSSVEHPKFRAFLQQVGLPPISRRELAGARLDARYEEARCASDARIQDALFFQVASDGWKSRASICGGGGGAIFGGGGDEGLVNLAVNLPNGTSVFRRAVFTNGRGVPSKYAEEILWETVTGICGSMVHRCVGIVSDKFKSTALRELENQNHWMVNLSCQLQGFNSLVKDFARELPLFRNVTANCSKIANFFNTKAHVRSTFHKYQLQELDHAGLLREAPPPPPSPSCDLWGGAAGSRVTVSNLVPVFAMLEDIIASDRALRLVVHDESYELVCVDDPIAREVAEMIRDMGFWGELVAVHSLVKLIKAMTQEMEAERPLVGQCLPLWDELRSKVKEWCVKYNVDDGPVEKVIEKRFAKNYHPAWSAAFVLDPLYLMRDTSGKYLPPFKYLTPEQEKDVDKLITRLVSREEAHIALMELMKWRSEGLDPLYAQAVQLKQRDPSTGKMRIANPRSSRLVWETCLSEFKSLGKVAVRLIFLHATSCGFKCNWSLLRWVGMHGRSRAGMDRAQKMVFVAAHAKLERRDFSNEEERDAELFANGEEDVLNEVFADASSV